MFDPRAGHGPGIGGHKRDSEVGMALHEGHAVCCVMVYPDTCTGQKLSDVHHALRHFVGALGWRHADPAPVLVGNWQAGSAVVVLAAECVGTAGLAVLTGAALCCGSGGAGVKPIRMAGGLGGGVRGAHLIADRGICNFGATHISHFNVDGPAA